MTTAQFHKIIRPLLRETLGPHGFTDEMSKHCVFHRHLNTEVYHVVIPDLGTRGEWYDIKVFPTAPAIQPRFTEVFPDNLGVPTDSFSYLHSERGVGLDHEMFSCRNEDRLRRGFARVERALREEALPYLDRIRSIEDVIPLIRHNLFLGLALHHAGRKRDAEPILIRERSRLLNIGRSDPDVSAWVEEIDRVLDPHTC